MTAVSTGSLSKSFGNLKALDNLNLEVPDNIVFGFLGPNGAGKTTTVKVLTGFSRPTSGTACVAGETVSADNTRLRSKIGFMPDVPSFYDWMSGREFMHMVGELHHLSFKDSRSQTEELLKLVALEKAAGRHIGTYSRGMKQRLGIAQALVNRPRVIFMDEPTSALDPIGRREILQLVSQLKHTATVFMSTHILSDVERVCDMVGIINKGRLVTVSKVADLQKKYTRSVFEIEFMEDATIFAGSLKTHSWLADPRITTETGRQVIKVRAVDMEHARRELPGLIGESGLTMTRYELVVPDLEDIFMNIINGSNT
jgi:ABC-2 type transport system ATP-binding protein